MRGDSNKEKAESGVSTKTSLKDLLDQCKGRKYIVSIEHDYSVGREGFGDKGQFKAKALIQFYSGEKWLLYTTSSFRSDRFKGNEWDASNILEIDKKITSVYMVYADGLKQEEKIEFERYSKKCNNGNLYTPFTDIVSQEKIVDMIEERALENKSEGFIKTTKGNTFEDRVAKTLENKQNIEKWNKQSNNGGIHYPLFEKIAITIGLKQCIKTAKATSDKKEIGKLPTGGNPKTDVLLTVEYEGGKNEVFTFSCKRSESKNVTVHEYKADDFADVLNKDDEKLRNLLKGFQESGSLSEFGKENCKALEEVIKPYNLRLTEWVIGGFHGGGDPNTQWAKYLIVYTGSDETVKVIKTEDYCKNIISGDPGNFGTPFKWTYPSKKKGKSIQLKTKID